MAKAKKKKWSTRIPSTHMKKGVAPTLKLAQKAVADGTAAIKANRKAIKAASTGKTKNKAAAAKHKTALKKNQKKLAKAKNLLESLKRTEKLANSLCPFEVQLSEFEFS